MIIWVSERFKPSLARQACDLKNEMIIWVSKFKPLQARQACVLKNEMIIWVG